MKTTIALIAALALTPLVPGLANAQDSSGSGDMQYNSTQDRTIQFGADFESPYRVSDPEGRMANMLGFHADYFIHESASVGLQAIFGVEDQGFADTPVFLTPGLHFYPTPGETFEPVISAEMPFELNNGDDFGVRGGLGLLWNTHILGLGLRYTFNAGYFFDSEDVVLTLANISAVFNW